jgi:hypothetical protein
LPNFASGGATLLIYDSKAVCMQRDQLLDFAERYTAAWCSQDAASVAAFL